MHACTAWLFEHGINAVLEHIELRRILGLMQACTFAVVTKKKSTPSPPPPAQVSHDYLMM